MKNKFLLLLFIVFSINCFSQEHLINGTVYSAETRKPVSKVKVTLHMPDKKTMEFTTDSTGTYSFKASGPGKFYITAEKCIKGRCATGECYLNKKFVIDTNALKHDNSIFCDLTLMRVKSEYNFPTIYFKKNSIIPDSCSAYAGGTIDSALYCVSELLHLNPTMQITIDGFAGSGEVETEDLSRDRATAIKNMLLKYSIDEKRLVAKGFGTMREAQHKPNNKMVTFSIIKF